MKRFAYLSLLGAIITITLKIVAFWITQSVSLLSDALESFINLFASLILLLSIHISQKPPDKNHLYGHGKIEYFSSGFEGLLIISAGMGIIITSAKRFIHPFLPSSLEIGLPFSIASAGINFILAKILIKAAREFDSIALEADAKHIMADVYTTSGIVMTLGIVYLFPHKLKFVDPTIAILLGIHLLRGGIDLIKKSVAGLMDHSISGEEILLIEKILENKLGDNKRWHGLKARRSGPTRFIEFHLLFPGKTTVKKSHDVCCEIEKEISSHIPNCKITIHVEPQEESEGRGQFP